MIRSGGALRALVTFGVLMLLVAWVLRRLVLPDGAASDGPAGAVRAYYARRYVPADLLDVKGLAPKCENGDGSACTALGRQLAGLRIEFPEFAPPDCLERGLFEKPCTAGDMIACTELAHSLDDGGCGDSDPARAQALYARACAARLDRACDWLDAG